MSWLERTRRKDVGQSAPADLIVKEKTSVEPTETSFLDNDVLGFDEAQTKLPLWRRCLAFLFKPWPSFILFVILPAAAIVVYYAVVAADQYVVESRFVVRQVEDTSFATSKLSISSSTAPTSSDSSKAGEGGGTSVGGAASRSSANSTIMTDDRDAYVVASYINSSAIIDDVSNDLNIEKMFRRPEADFWARLQPDASQEEVQRYWGHMVNAYVDRLSNIVTVEVRAFRREDALMLSNAILASATKLVNNMSLRARNDAVTRAKEEVERTDRSMRLIMADMETFRNREGLIDPINTATNTGDLLRQLLSKRIATDAELYVTRKMRPDAPNIPTLEEHLKALDARIAELRATLTDKDAAARTISATLSGFDELEVKEQLAKEMYIDARVAEENTERSAQGRWLYLAVFDPPLLPDDSEYPDRLAFSSIGVIVLFAVWATAALIWASVLDHQT